MSGSGETIARPGRGFGRDTRSQARIAQQSHTVRRILTGALVAATRHGVDGLSMAEIADAAQVSRRTLYRYFSGREALLECMSEQVRRRWELVLHEAVRDEPTTEQRVRVVMRSILCMAEVVPESKSIFENAPAYALAYLQHHFPDFAEQVVKAMAPALDTAVAVRAGMLDEHEVAEIVVRIGMADFLVPGDRVGTLTERVEAFWSFVGGQVPCETRETPGPALWAVPDLALG